jgi:hypothetical protein
LPAWARTICCGLRPRAPWRRPRQSEDRLLRRDIRRGRCEDVKCAVRPGRDRESDATRRSADTLNVLGSDFYRVGIESDCHRVRFSRRHFVRRARRQSFFPASRTSYFTADAPPVGGDPRVFHADSAAEPSVIAAMRSRCAMLARARGDGSCVHSRWRCCGAGCGRLKHFIEPFGVDFGAEKIGLGEDAAERVRRWS